MPCPMKMAVPPSDCLLTGPNLNPILLSIPMKFRLHEIAFTADIKKAFLQKSLAERERDAVRFLLLTGPPRGENEEELRVLRITRMLFGVSPSPFLLTARQKNQKLSRHWGSHSM